MVASPSPLAVTSPPGDTSATPGLSERHAAVAVTSRVEPSE